MAQAWAALAGPRSGRASRSPTCCDCTVENAELRSTELADELSRRLGRPVNSGWVRVNLHRARDMFVESLLGEVERSLDDPSNERLEEELIELGLLLEHCRSVLKRRRRTGRVNPLQARYCDGTTFWSLRWSRR